MLLSIIVPAYNAEPYINALMERLETQISEDVEVIVIDDGSKVPYVGPKWAKVYRQENGGVSAARNKGLDEAKGKYIAFIDADDLVTEDYIAQIRSKIEEGCDYIYLSWETIGRGWQARVILRSVEDKFPPDNLCVWNRVYRKDMIGETRFNNLKKVAEDAEFIRLVETSGKKGIISKPIYLYRSDTPNSLSKRFRDGVLDTKRVVYYFRRVTKDMELLEEFKEVDKTAEVILMTERNDQPELERYAMVIPPRPITATEAKGEHCSLIKIIEPPKKTQVVIWTSFAQEIGGIETFTYSFCKQMSKHYDIIVLYDQMDPRQIDRCSKYVECVKNDPKKRIECEVLIVNRILKSDNPPENVTAKKTVQMVHGAKISYADVPQDRDTIVTVSEYVKKTWGDRTKDAVVIHNILSVEKPKEKPLLLVTASRLDAPDKGLKRMIELGRLMEEQGILYTWLVFTNTNLPNNAPKSMTRREPTMNILPWIQKADYLVQISDEEAFCYSLAEALSVGTPVIVTPLAINEELQIEDGANGYVVPFDVKDYDTTHFKKVPKFKWSYDNDEVVDKWIEVLGEMIPTHSYNPTDLVTIKATRDYCDSHLGKLIRKGETTRVSKDRADVITGAGYAIKI